MRRALDWTRYPSRTCKNRHDCELCRKDIAPGQRYFDGGYGRYAHEWCVTSLPPALHGAGEKP